MGEASGKAPPPPAVPAADNRLSLLVFDGHFARVHYALVLASAAAAVNRPVTLFFAGDAVPALTPQGWRWLTGDPANEAAEMKARGIAGFDELLEACAAMDVRFMACELALRRLGLEHRDLDPALEVTVAGAVSFLGQSQPGAGSMLFI